MLIEGSLNEDYSPRRDKAGRIVSDVGYFARVRNPYNPEATVILVAGIHTTGVRGAALAFGDQVAAIANHRWLAEQLGPEDYLSFECVFPVEVVDGEAFVPNLSSARMWRI